MKITREKITPAKAKAMLEKNDNNRIIKKPRVNSFAAIMEAGKWKEDNGETLTIDINDDMLNGQHRLNALVDADVSLYFWVARGADPEVKNTIDTGKSRTVSDVFSLNGENYAPQKASLANYIDAWIRGSVHYDSSFSSALKKLPQLSHDQLFELFKLYEKDFKWICPYAELNVINGCAKGQFTFALILLRQNRPKAVLEDFLDCFRDGGDYKESPTHRLPFYIMKRRDSGLKRHRREDLFLVLHAFELWEKQRPWLNRNIRLEHIIQENHKHFYESFKIKGKWKDIITEEYLKPPEEHKVEGQKELI